MPKSLESEIESLLARLGSDNSPTTSKVRAKLEAALRILSEAATAPTPASRPEKPEK